MCVFVVYFHAQRGRRGQVFTLTRLNEGCVRLCVGVRNCLFAFVRTCFSGEYTSECMDGSSRVYYELLSGFFVHNLQRKAEICV